MAVDDVDVTFTHKMFFYVNWMIAILKAVTIIECAAIQISRCLIRPLLDSLLQEVCISILYHQENFLVGLTRAPIILRHLDHTISLS